MEGVHVVGPGKGPWPVIHLSNRPMYCSLTKTMRVFKPGFFSGLTSSKPGTRVSGFDIWLVTRQW